MKKFLLFTLSVCFFYNNACFAGNNLNKSDMKGSGQEGGKIVVDDVNKVVSISDGSNQITFKLNYSSKCIIEDVRIRGSENIVDNVTGVCTAINVGGNWATTRDGIATPTVVSDGNMLTINNIKYASGVLTVMEKWIFTTYSDHIDWEIGRKYLGAGTLIDSYFPGWDFISMDTWDGALLDNGAVAWTKFLETNSATLGQHAETITLWNKKNNSCLRIIPDTTNRKQFAYRFSHQPSGYFSLCQSVTNSELQPNSNLSRFLSNRQDIWKPFTVKQNDSVGAKFSFYPLKYDSIYDRGSFVGVDGNVIREMFHTIARYGVIDKNHVGGNGWRSGYICLHEQWWPQIAAALHESDYTQCISNSYNYYRDKAVQSTGRVKSRFKDTPGDNMAGTYDANGFYEAQWGYLMDSQTDYVMVVAEQFQNTGDIIWARGQKQTCEKVLDYLLKRDANKNSLFEVMNNNHTEGKSSDWIDIIWASYENALINAELYNALKEWARVEDVLKDSTKARNYRTIAAKLKTAFNKPVSQGGFWNPDKKWYVYWRDKDKSIHGNNLTMPINICAIAYGLCDDTARISSILSQMETKMVSEKLFFWPLCFYTFASGEGSGGQWPFPNYENGDIFLSWGELAIRAYVKYNPAIALKYVKNVLNRYAQDGLAYQRYLRGNQQGSGDDILSGNCMAVVGLYRDIYGIQPLHNGLYLEPHILPELNGTKLKYWLRDKIFSIELKENNYSVTVNGVTVKDTVPFALDDNGNRMSLKALFRADSIINDTTTIPNTIHEANNFKNNASDPIERFTITWERFDISLNMIDNYNSVNASIYDSVGRKISSVLNEKYKVYENICCIIP